MFVLKKILIAFLVPPGIIILLLLAVAWRARRRRQNSPALALVIIALLIWAVSAPPVGRALMTGLERGLSIPGHPQGDVIVLLGGGTHDKVPDLSGRGTPSGNSLPRVVTAARLQKRLAIPVIISGGGVFEGRTAEAVISRRFLMDLGVPADKILLEDKSRDTIENARYTRQILEKHGFRKPLLVTSAFHMRRSVAAFRQFGIEVTPVPTHFMSSIGTPLVWFDWLPDAGAMGLVAIVMKEHIGMLYYRLTGPGGV
jgi:uncharacterized SAM-binding protein YcdF (DUF218 family)